MVFILKMRKDFLSEHLQCENPFRCLFAIFDCLKLWSVAKLSAVITLPIHSLHVERGVLHLVALLRQFCAGAVRKK